MSRRLAKQRSGITTRTKRGHAGFDDATSNPRLTRSAGRGSWGALRGTARPARHAAANTAGLPARSPSIAALAAGPIRGRRRSTRPASGSAAVPWPRRRPPRSDRRPGGAGPPRQSGNAGRAAAGEERDPGWRAAGGRSAGRWRGGSPPRRRPERLLSGRPRGAAGARGRRSRPPALLTPPGERSGAEHRELSAWGGADARAEPPGEPCRCALPVSLARGGCDGRAACGSRGCVPRGEGAGRCGGESRGEAVRSGGRRGCALLR